MKKESLDELIEITDINSDGCGVGRTAAGKVIFVRGAVTGDTVTADIIKRAKDYDVCSVRKTVVPSPDRCEPCKYAKRCGGCVYSAITYAAELRHKERFVTRELRRAIPHDTPIEPIAGGEPERYRNKAAYPVGYDGSGKLSFGYYARHSHDIVFHSSCLLQDNSFASLARAFLNSAQQLGLTPYDEKSGKGLLRHLVIRKNESGELMLCVVINAVALPFQDVFASELAKAFPKLRSFSYSPNLENTNVITGSTYVEVFGSGLTDTVCGKTFSLSPLSFWQVNRAMAQRLYCKAAEYAASGDGKRTFLDLYCGTGTVGLSTTEPDDRLFGVEIIPQAVKDAALNAKQNGRSESNTRFICGDASLGVDECTRVFGKPDVILADPPRKGLSNEVITLMTDAAPERIIYISCNPSTLARDLKKFASRGYICRRAAPFDLFPRTFHVETVVLMSRVKG